MLVHVHRMKVSNLHISRAVATPAPLPSCSQSQGSTQHWMHSGSRLRNSNYPQTARKQTAAATAEARKQLEPSMQGMEVTGSKEVRMELLVSLDYWFGSKCFMLTMPTQPYTRIPFLLHFPEVQILTCVLKFHWKCISLWDSHNVEFQNVCVICYAQQGQQSYQNCTRRFAKNRILNRAETMGFNVRNWH